MASGDTIDVFKPIENAPPASAAAPLIRVLGRLVLAFDGAANESAVFESMLPRSYAGGGITIDLYFFMESSTSGDVDLDVAIEALGDTDDATADSFATAQSVDNTTVPGTAGDIKKVSVTFTDGAQMDSAAAGNLMRYKVTRDAVSDSTSDDLYLMGVEIRET